MIIIFPYWTGDIGFLLSFIATLSLLLFEKPVRKKLKVIPGIFRESLSTTLAAQIGVTPILYVTFGSIYILSPVVNALVLWTIPFITILGMIASLTLYIVPGLSRLVLYLAYPLTLWFAGVVEVFAK
jgi:competence protein ComEC